MKDNKKLKRIEKYLRCIYFAFVITLMVVNVYATTEDPLAVVNNLSDFIFGIIRAIGLIILGFSIVQFGLAIKGHDPSQRANSILGIAGGIIITFAKEILTIVTG